MSELLGPRPNPRARLRELLAAGSVLAPGAYDALSARLVAQAGFDAVYMTGFGTCATLWAGRTWGCWAGRRWRRTPAGWPLRWTSRCRCREA